MKSPDLSLDQTAAESHEENIFGRMAANKKLIELLSFAAGLTLLSGSIFLLLNVTIGPIFGPIGERINSLFVPFSNSIFSQQTTQLLAVYLAIFIIEIVVMGYRKSALKSLLNPDPSTKADIFIFLLSILGIKRYTTMFSFFLIGYYIESKANLYFDFNFIQHLDSIALQIIISLLVYDFLDYWAHRFAHRISWWWATHVHHHSAEKFNVITVDRTHPLDLALAGAFVVIPMAMIGVPLETFIVLQILSSAQGKLQHSMIDWDFGIIGRYLIVSPVAHRIHHSPAPEHWDKNYGHFSVIWDRMFGTWYDGDFVNTKIGLLHNPDNKHHFLYDWIHGQLEFFKCLTSKWDFKVGVLEHDEMIALNEEYKKRCEKEGITP